METIEYQVRLDDLMPLFREQLSAGNAVKFAPCGISMLPMLRQGIDSVVLSPAPEKLKKYDLPLYRRDDGKYILHRVVKVEETYTCIGDNQFVFESGVRHDQVIGLVTAFTRGEALYSVKLPAYKLYCRVWHYSRGFRHFWRRGIGWIKRHIM